MATLDWPVNAAADGALTQRPKGARFIIYETQTPEQRRARGKKAWKTRLARRPK